MAVEEKLSLEGVVEESLPNLMFRVELDNGHSVLAHMAGRMRRDPPSPPATGNTF